MDAIRLEQVTKRFESALVIPRVDLEIADGELVVFSVPLDVEVCCVVASLEDAFAKRANVTMALTS